MNKLILILSMTFFSANVFAAATLFCNAEDGTILEAVENSENQRLQDFKLKIRSGKSKSYPNAYVAAKEESNGVIKFLVVTDPDEGILVVVRGETFIDGTGTYEVKSCEITM